mmetsp:Transcript_42334/g.90372  ORF Transcript_42334/g.90372 Transcript_42334/m.90372 type:complete len:295 (-) Transcript_42334:804-1688(-)
MWRQPISLLLLVCTLPHALGRCCSTHEFCSPDDTKCVQVSCAELLKRVCGVSSCCSCDSADDASSCDHKLCRSEGSMCVEYELPSGQTAALLSCGQDVTYEVDAAAGCSAMTVVADGENVQLFDGSAECVDDGSAICQVGFTFAAAGGGGGSGDSNLASLGRWLSGCGESNDDDIALADISACGAGISNATAGGLFLAGFLLLLLCCCAICCCVVASPGVRKRRQLRTGSPLMDVSSTSAVAMTCQSTASSATGAAAPPPPPAVEGVLMGEPVIMHDVAERNYQEGGAGQKTVG